MTTSLMLATTLLGTPVNLTGPFTGFPGVANPSNLQLRVTAHNVTLMLYLLETRSESVTVIKNGSATGGPITLSIPLHIRRVKASGAFKPIAFKGTWDKAPITFKNSPLESTPTTDNFINQKGWAKATVQIKPGATHALRLSWTGDLLLAGKDLKMKALAYDTSPARDWIGGIAQFNYSIRFQFTDHSQVPGGPLPKATESPVFSVMVKNPEVGWSVGNNGSFWMSKPLVVPEDPVLSLAYYPGGYRNIGG